MLLPFVLSRMLCKQVDPCVLLLSIVRVTGHLACIYWRMWRCYLSFRKARRAESTFWVVHCTEYFSAIVNGTAALRTVRSWQHTP
mmetsp:Transcript_163192/g.518545  ORF Transcript_163192/g.518545 Transcript_163192/m.518545 type:complete len:85 (-) Transcript_163192:229-483(-)